LSGVPHPFASSTEPTPVGVETADGTMPGQLWRPAAGSGPGLVLVQEIFGVTGYIRDRAADLADLGYVVCAPEIYWRLPHPGIDPAGDALGQGVALSQQVDWDLATADVVATLDHLRQRPEVVGGVGLVGFCFGGGLAFSAAAADDPDVLVSYYGSALPRLLDLADQVTAPSLHHFGLADAYIPPDQVATIRAAVSRPGVTFETYPDAGHAFDNPEPAFHHPVASAAAWSATVSFLAERLPVRPA
jgi:carboxymethylenebutenolidase